MTISINQITSGMGIRIDQDIFIVTEYQHVKPGKGSAFVRVRLKNVKTKQSLERTFKSAEKLEDIELEERKMQMLYKSADGYHFMDQVTFEEVVVVESDMEQEVKFIQDDAQVVGLFYGKDLLKITLPTFIEAEIIHTEPGFRGDTSKAGTKPATIDAGATVQVPLFVEIGDWIKIDTRTAQYVERIKK